MFDFIKTPLTIQTIQNVTTLEFQLNTQNWRIKKNK